MKLTAAERKALEKQADKTLSDGGYRKDGRPKGEVHREVPTVSSGLLNQD